MNLSEFCEKLKHTEFATHMRMKCRVTVCNDFVNLEYGYDKPKRDFLLSANCRGRDDNKGLI